MLGPRSDSMEWLVFLRQQVPLPEGEPGWLWSTGMEDWVKPPWGAILWDKGTVSLRPGQQNGTDLGHSPDRTDQEPS